MGCLTTCEDKDFVNAVSRCMHDDDQLATGYEVKRHRYKLVDLDNDAAAPAIEKRVALRKTAAKLDVFPQEVGVGISQVLPIVVACLEPSSAKSARHESSERGRQQCWSWAAIEQPELHLHPRMQCALGDVLIQGALGHRTTMTNLIYRNSKGEVVPQRQWSVGDSDERVEQEEDVSAKEEKSDLQTPRCVIVETHSEHLILRIRRPLGLKISWTISLSPPVVRRRAMWRPVCASWRRFATAIFRRGTSNTVRSRATAATEYYVAQSHSPGRLIPRRHLNGLPIRSFFVMAIDAATAGFGWFTRKCWKPSAM